MFPGQLWASANKNIWKKNIDWHLGVLRKKKFISKTKKCKRNDHLLCVHCSTEQLVQASVDDNTVHNTQISIIKIPHKNFLIILSEISEKWKVILEFFFVYQKRNCYNYEPHFSFSLFDKKSTNPINFRIKF